MFPGANRFDLLYNNGRKGLEKGREVSAQFNHMEIFLYGGCQISRLCWLIATEWHIYASGINSIIASDNGLAPRQRQAIIWTNTLNIFQWNFISNSELFIQRNALENVVCEIAAILYLPQCVNI